MHPSHHSSNNNNHNDDVTVVTSNTAPRTTPVTAPPWVTVGRPRTNPPQSSIALASPVVAANYYAPLSFDHDAIVVDSGASEGFGGAETYGINRRPVTRSVIMASATGHQETSIAKDEFDVALPAAAKEYHVLPKGTIKRPLLSVGKACDAGLDVWFAKGGKHAHFYNDGTYLLTANRDPATQLYLLPQRSRTTDDVVERHMNPVPPRAPADDIGLHVTGINQHHGLNVTQPLGLGLGRQRPLLAFNTHEHASSVPGLIHYLHACAGFPKADTWIKAINAGHYIGWPGLTASRVRKYLGQNEITAMGHLKLQRQGVRSTSKGGNTSRPTALTLGRRRNVAVGSTPLKGIMGTDQTGRLPITSRRGHKYIFVLCDMDTGYIYGVPIKSRKPKELIRAYNEAYIALVKCGFEPVLHRIDNETSDTLIDAIEEKQLDYEYMPKANHRRNPAERAIQTYKSHFISIINGVDKEFPPDAWDLLMAQTNITLNLLRTCPVNPAHSAYSYIHGPYDFSAHPLAPLGCRAVSHVRAIKEGGTRGAWGNRGKVAYYVGPKLKAYRVWYFYDPDTRRVHDNDTAEFYPNIKLPVMPTSEHLSQLLDRIKELLEAPTMPHLHIDEDEKLDAVLRRLRHLYDKDSTISKPSTGGVPSKPATEPGSSVALPRVDPSANRINRYEPKKKQRFPLGTRVRIKEARGSFIGKATGYDPHTGLYHVVFDDGEYEEFDNAEMAYFQLRAPRHGNSAQIASAEKIRVLRNSTPERTPYLKAMALLHAETNLRPVAKLRGTPILYGLNAGSIWDDEMGRWMAYRDLINHPNPAIKRRWVQAGINEFARLAQGHGDTEGMDVVEFIDKSSVPRDKQVTYARYVVDYRPEKDEPWRLRITCGGDRLDYDGNTTTHGASMEVIKCQLNDIVSTPGARAATADISNMYLGSDLPESEYVRFQSNLIPQAIKDHYGLDKLAGRNSYVYAKVNKAWYGLKQAGKIAHDDLVQRLATHGYKKTVAEGYFRHETRDISFTLVVDDFLIKYTNQADLDHLTESVRQHYKLKVDTEAKQYVGIHLRWDYERRTVKISMDGYVEQALMELEHECSTTTYAPSYYTPPKYGAKVQFATVDTSAVLNKRNINFIQRAIGKLLYYARAVDPTMLHAINDISRSAAKGTEATLAATVHLLNYAHTFPNATTIYRASDMVLRVDSDAAYLVAPEARSRAGGYHYLSDKAGTVFNGPVLVLAKVIKNVMASAAEAELGALFMNAQEAVALRNCLEAMGYPQPPTSVKTDNNTAQGIINNTMKQKRSKAIDMRFHWLRDRVNQHQFHVYWESGKTNLADYYTKHHPINYHRTNRPIHTYVEGVSPSSLQGCVDLMTAKDTDKPQP